MNQKPFQFPMIIKNLERVDKGSEGKVWQFDIVFADSRHHYDTDYVHARDARAAMRKIKRLYAWVERFDFGGYAQ